MLPEVSVNALKGKMGMAQFLHDTVNSNLAVLKMQLCHMYKHTRSRAQKRELKSMCDLVDQLIASIRQTSSGIRQGEDEKESLYAAIGNCARDFDERTGIRTFFHSVGGDDHIPTKISTAVLGVLREALANVVRH